MLPASYSGVLHDYIQQGQAEGRDMSHLLYMHANFNCKGKEKGKTRDSNKGPYEQGCISNRSRVPYVPGPISSSEGPFSKGKGMGKGDDYAAGYAEGYAAGIGTADDDTYAEGYSEGFDDCWRGIEALFEKGKGKGK